jgi:hypothetical protein
MVAMLITASQREIEDRREYPRLLLPLRLALVYHQRDAGGARPTFHGTSHDICMSGLSMIVGQSIFQDGEITVLLALPPAHAGARQKIIAASAEMSYAVHSSRLQAYKVGITFREFRGDGRELLRAALLRELSGSGVAAAEQPVTPYTANRPSDSQPLRC